jgi:hypothetical protein
MPREWRGHERSGNAPQPNVPGEAPVGALRARERGGATWHDADDPGDAAVARYACQWIAFRYRIAKDEDFPVSLAVRDESLRLDHESGLLGARTVIAVEHATKPEP